MSAQQKKKRKKWIRFRHQLIRWLAMPILIPWTRLKYHVRIVPFRQQGRPYLILSNHQTGFDQFYVAILFRRPVYFLASEDLFSMGFVSSVIRWCVAPIPIKKQTTDIGAVRNCLRVAKEGGTVCIFPEGNRTFHGRTVYMNPSIAELAKKLGLPIALMRIEGGYGVQPRWSDVTRKGKMTVRVSRVLEPEDYRDLPAAELFEIIRNELTVDEACSGGPFYSKRNAEYLERAMYVCPWCGVSELRSRGDVIECQRCHRRVRHLPSKELEGLNCEFPYRLVGDWYDAQCSYVNRLPPEAFTETPAREDSAVLSEVILYRRKQLLRKRCSVSLYADRIAVDERGEEPLLLPFAEVSAVTVLGRNKLDIYHGGRVYQLTGEPWFNALIYVNLFHRYKNVIKGEDNGEFLGL